MNDATKIFIKEHVNDDVYTMALQISKYPDVDMPFAVRQISGKQKVIHKIPSFYECDDLLYPQKLSLEQSSSEITANYKAANCKGSVIIDLTGGFGVDSFFFSKKFKRVFYVERQEELCVLAKHNFPLLGSPNISVLNELAENYLEQTEKVDWIYLDPARRTEEGKKAVLLSDCEPNVAQLENKLLNKASHVMIKLSPMIDISELRRELKQISEIHIIAVENECKEVVTILENRIIDSVIVKTINFKKNGLSEAFDFDIEAEQKAVAPLSDKVMDYLYEPNAAIMKSGAFRLISEKLHVKKLHTNSHLYTSDHVIPDFPGRVFNVINVYDFSKESLKSLHTEVRKANLSVRNFPLTVNELRKKLKLAEGGEDYIFATTLSDEKKVLVHCKKNLEQNK